MKREPRFKTEADMCTAFMMWAREKGFVPYPETGGWDIVLVGPEGAQIGIQAKLKFNMSVLLQTVESSYAWTEEGPDYRAVLIPLQDGRADLICGAMGIKALHGKPVDDGSRYYREEPFSPEIGGSSPYNDWHYWNPVRRIKLPDYVPDVIAGASGPIQLTHWKVQALRIAAVLEIRGYVTKADFKRFGVDPRRWFGPNDWLQSDAEGRFVRGPGLNFDKQHPEVWPKILADVRANGIADKEGTLL